MLTAMSEPVIVVEYDPVWPSVFLCIATPVWAALGERIVSIDHIGSTPVPGCPAKPIIDLDVVVRTERHVPLAIELASVCVFERSRSQRRLRRGDAFERLETGID